MRNIYILMSFILLTTLAISGCANDFVSELNNSNQNENQRENQNHQIIEAEFLKTFYIALEDAGQNGVLIGCDDSAIEVNSPIIKGSGNDLESLYNVILSDKSSTHGQSGLSNTLANSDLTLSSIKQESDSTHIYLDGELEIGGICDQPRLYAQLTYPLQQFSEIQSYEVFINNENIHDLFDLVGSSN